MTGVQELIDRSIPFLEVVKNRTAGAELELRLNGTYGSGSALYDDLARMIRDGVRPARPATPTASRFARGSRPSARASTGTCSGSRPTTRPGVMAIPQASLIDFHPVLRRHAAVPADQVIVCGIALGAVPAM